MNFRQLKKIKGRIHLVLDRYVSTPSTSMGPDHQEHIDRIKARQYES